MKLKRGILLIALTLAILCIIGLFTNVQADISIVTDKTLSIKGVRPAAGYSYKFTKTSSSDTSTSITNYIWKIYNTVNDINETFYCIKGGPGFGSGTMGSSITPAVYKKAFDMKKPNEIPETPINYKRALLDPTSKDYERLMWVLDQCYIPAKLNASDADKETAAKSKQALLDAVEKYIIGKESKYENVAGIYDKLTKYLTEDDIDAIQQLAVWYYTNDDGFHVENDPNIKFETLEGTDVSLNINVAGDKSRINAMNALYDYLTKTPKQSGFSYDYASIGSISDPVEIANTLIDVEPLGDRVLVGPFRIDELRENISYSLDGTFIDGSNKEITDVKFYNNNKEQMSSSTTLKDLVDKNFYISIPKTANSTNVKLNITGSYFVTRTTYWSVENPGTNDQPVVQVEKIRKDFEDETSPTPKFDLALRKFITSIEDKDTGEKRTPEKRVPTISESEINKLANGSMTANKVHNKNAQPVKTGEHVIYTIRIYNEGEVNGYATEVTDYLPEGLKFLKDSKINKDYGWSNPSNDGKTIVTSYLADKEIEAFNGTEIKFKDLQIECEVEATVTNKDQTLKNVAEITKHKDKNENTSVIDRDSQPGSLKQDDINKYGTTSKQDDDDFEQLVLAGQYFDLALRKFITGVTSGITGKPIVLMDRTPKPDITPLLNGKDTANYNHTKEPVGVSNGDIVTYKIRVYNEGQLAGYVNKITDHLPPQLEFIIDDELNAKYGWNLVEGSNGREVYTDITSLKTTHTASRDTIYADRDTGSTTDKVLLKAFDRKNLDYIDVEIRCRVKENINLYEKITNIAEVTEFEDINGGKVDRDSQGGNVTIPSNLPEYNQSKIDRGDKYIEGQQDDDDFEKLVLRRFDLALRKFITGVVNGEKTTNITSRVPVFNKVSDTEYTYEQPKDPVEVANGNIVIYTLRIFNEGNVAGYASEVKDNLPDGLEFLPEDSTNKAFGWKMYRQDGTETKDIKEASYIKTDFLSKDNEKTKGENLIAAFDPETMTMPAYKDLKIAFKVTEPNTSDRIIINTAEITDDSDEKGDPIDDIDSTPDNNKEGEDDIDIEKIKVKYFDLSLKKWVTESIVTYNGKTTVTKSGHTGNENPEPPMKVEIRTDRINKTKVKFRFKIKVTNEGEIAGYAKEIIDYIPAGLKFEAKDNPKWKEVNGKVTTDQLKDKLLQPGQSATVEIVLTWINGKNNMGTKVNWAEISKDQNEYNSPDIDSTPGNNVKGEDDIDQAPVLLSPATGSVQVYMGLTVGCIAIIAGGVFLIKKFVI